MSEHISVLLPEALSLLHLKEDGIYLDLTLGRGGHSAAILSRISSGHLYAFDLDETAIAESRPRLEVIGNNFTLIHDNFANAKVALERLGVDKVDGILMDLGVSSPQFDDGERGFSYRYDAPLDMRMDQTNGASARDIVNNYPVGELIRVFREYGEDPDAPRVAHAIALARAQKPIETTGELVEIIKNAKPNSSLKKKGHPAKQIFQALRIETNDELGSLEAALESLPGMLKEGGVIAVITFHSLEDRIVKQTFRGLTRVIGSRNAPFLKEDSKPQYNDLTRHPIVPGEKELLANHRAASAKLRAIERR